MLIRIEKAGPGCTYQPGQVLKTNTKRARYLIEKGFAVFVVDDNNPEEVLNEMQAANTVKTPMPVITMQPLRHICGCGLVCRDEDELRAHREVC